MAADVKFGRKPAVFPGALRDLTFYSAGPLPAAPASVAVPEVADWGMLGNDQYGDCGVAGLEHGLMAVATDIQVAYPQATEQQCTQYYFNYTKGQDSGVVLSDFLAFVKANTYYGKHVEAYAPVTVQNIPALHFTVNAYDFAYCGISVTQSMMDAFSAGQPWTLGTSQDQPVGGHCIPVVGYDSRYLYAVTWGKVQPIEYSAWTYVAEEAWAVLTGEIKQKGTDGHGIDYRVLEGDLSRLNP